LLLAPAAHADDLCETLNSLVLDIRQDLIPYQGPPGVAECRDVRTLGGQLVYNCFWEFPFRSAEATEHYEALNGAIRDCFGNRLVPTEDLGVNHPDTYSQWIYDLEGTAIRASIKDKSALDKTLVFLGIASSP
jgi:hypothetical protein